MRGSVNLQWIKSTILVMSCRQNGIKPDPDKVKAILEMRQPTDVTSVRSLLGMANFLSKFIPHLSSKTKPLRDLLNKHNAWTWSSAQQHAFETLKSALSIKQSTTVVRSYKENGGIGRCFIIWSRCSDNATTR